MFTQSDWIDLVKGRLRIRTDYKLSKLWGISQAEICQYRQNRLKIPLALIIEMADIMKCNPLEILLGLELRRCKPKHKDKIKTEYFKILRHSEWYISNKGFMTYKKRRINF